MAGKRKDPKTNFQRKKAAYKRMKTKIKNTIRTINSNAGMEAKT